MSGVCEGPQKWGGLRGRGNLGGRCAASSARNSTMRLGSLAHLIRFSTPAVADTYRVLEQLQWRWVGDGGEPPTVSAIVRVAQSWDGVSVGRVSLALRRLEAAGIVRVGPDGTARVEFDLPDFNGSVRVMAVAWSEGRIGSAAMNQSSVRRKISGVSQRQQ